METLGKIQKELRVPKLQRNSFGNYNYRSCEDIVEAVKPLLPEGAYLTLTDDIVLVGSRYYVKATATLHHGESKVSVTGYAREAENKKGQDESQITGSASSYARKYALNGLLLIDDTKDADTQDNTVQKEVKPVVKDGKEKIKELLQDLGYNPKTVAEAGKVVLELTDRNFLPEQYDTIISELTERIEARDALNDK